MKKWWLLCLAVILVLGTTLTYAEPIPVVFEKTGGGQFIYCNNPEYITQYDVSTDENPTPTYMMKNEALKADRYNVFFCFYNATDFNVEPDMEFVSASESATVTINSVGYYIPYGDENADCLGAWSDLLGVKIRTFNDFRQFVPYTPAQDEFPKTFTLDEANRWASEFIYNYAPIGPRKSFNMLVDFTIDSGEVDVNFAALKHYGITGDRTHHVSDASPGKYVRDTCVKGIEKNSLPIVETTLDIKINDETKNGENIPVKIYNQFQPEGNDANNWMTNINPVRDKYMYSKGVAVGSDMLSFEYADDSKLAYYGKNVPESKRDNIWVFDIYHQDTQGYQTGMAWDKKDHIPNRYTGDVQLVDRLPHVDWELNLGNFGVTNRYNLNITNDSQSDRVINYMLETIMASNLILIRDTDGNLLNPYTLEKEDAFVLSKGLINAKQEQCMASLPVAAGETKTYILEEILPTNCYGGILHSLILDDYKYLKEGMDTPFPEYTENSPVPEDVFYNGSEYMKWADDKLYTLTSRNTWREVTLSDDAKELFNGRGNLFKMVKTNHGYAVRFAAWDAFGFAFKEPKESERKVYFFDKNWNKTNIYTFPSAVFDMDYIDGTVYARSDKTYISTNDKTFSVYAGSEQFPIRSGETVLYIENGDMFTKDTQDKIVYEGFVAGDIKEGGDILYRREMWKWTYDSDSQNVIGVSTDGINWAKIELPDHFVELQRVLHFGGKIHVVCKYETFTFDDDILDIDPVNVQLKDEMLSFMTPAEIAHDRTMVPMRYFFEKVGATVDWNEKQGTATVKGKVAGVNTTIVLTINSPTALVNGEIVPLDAPAYIKDSKTLIPLRFLSETLGYAVDWNADKKLATVSEPPTPTPTQAPVPTLSPVPTQTPTPTTTTIPEVTPQSDIIDLD